ncbi:hypothetical protein HBH64_207350 [Parastagonospora nodorum]|nr:hypothetical protein HBH51_191560 [Parastagonospora nodorum]KAH4195528.1 hypothetical protein HBI95_194410 [Parastagonospora nodorum]KAH4288734.1 hypothetical protein HBI02_208920 [Parastagonospora nodorum]KAH4289488.1 hypothetical protein HBI01_209230 [Parastagonospora nodorum]KAH4321806.1 hypothetical protein HBI00_206720 [Parastagonospora nodorum]
MIIGFPTHPLAGCGERSERRSFKHEELNRTSRSFRLIKVQPDRSKEGHLQLSLWHDEVDSASYRCLSYRWGNQAQRYEILINGKLFRVGNNLHAFLEEVYAPNSRADASLTEALWIDSICIDQDSLEERSHQVQQMGDIYIKAKEVYIWLGQNHESGHELHEWLKSEKWEECPTGLREQWNRIRFDPYWYRAWIVQEVLLAKDLKVVLPNVAIDYRLLGRAVARTTDLEHLDQESAAQLWVFWLDQWGKSHQEVATVDWLRHERSRHDFWDLVHMHKRAECADERDRIYSLLGLISGNHTFQVDYGESTADLFWRVGEYFDAWQSPELVDILRIALLGTHSSGKGVKPQSHGISPWILADALKSRPNCQVRIPVRRARSTTSLTSRFTRRTKCQFKDCRRAPALRCTRNDILICTNARANGPTEHGCLHALASPLDQPAAEPFEIKLEAHHGATVARTTLPSTALQFCDPGTDSWVGISTWSSLRKALDHKDLDRADRVKLQVPAEYAIWIWFGIHPDQLAGARDQHYPELPSAHHALPPGTKITNGSIEVPSAANDVKGDARTLKEGIFGI